MALVERPTDLFRSKEVEKRPIQLYLEKSKKMDLSHVGSGQSQYSIEKHVSQTNVTWEVKKEEVTTLISKVSSTNDF